MTGIRKHPHETSHVKLAVVALFVLLTAACGTGQIQTNKPVGQGSESRIRANVVDLGNGFVQVEAQPTRQISGGSFVYCLSSLDACRSNPQGQQKLQLADGSSTPMGVATVAAHKIPQAISKDQVQVVSLSAIDFNSKNPIWLAVKLDGSVVEEERTDDQAAISSEPLNPAIDRFEYDRTSIERAAQKLTGVDFDYKFGQANLHATAPKIRTKITNTSLTAMKSKLGVVLGGYALTDSSKYVVSLTAVTLDDQGVLTLTGENLQPATVYKMRLHFFDRSDRTQATARYMGSTSRTYNFVTDGVGDALTRLRARIVMRGLAEESDWDLNRYDRSKNYTHGAGGWCHVFYNWVITPYLKTRSGSVNTHYSQSYWSGLGAVMNGSTLVEKSKTEAIMGDYFRVGSHAAMILAYDTAKKQFATLEGNFNNSVEFYQRSPGALSWVGHINSQMLKDSAVQELP